MTSLAVHPQSSEFVRTVGSRVEKFRPTVRTLAFHARTKRPEPDPVGALVQRVETIVHSALHARDAQEFQAHLRMNLNRFIDALDALRTLGGDLASVDESEIAQTFERAAVALAGEPAIGEITFCTDTYRRALRLVEQLDAATEARDPARDAELAQNFRLHTALHVFGILAILEASSHGVHATQQGISCSFEMARAGALHAFADVREAIELRKRPTPIDDGPESPFDDEDARLAQARRSA